MEVDNGVAFLGPARLEFESFQEQSCYYLDTYCKNWRNHENPDSYMVPPEFSFRLPEVSDEAIQNVKEKYADTSKAASSKNPKGKPDNLVQERMGEEAEHILHRMVYQDIHAGNFSPFIAIHSLKIDAQKQKILNQMFPSIPWFCCEYDYLLIGPKIGIVAIEVKSSNFVRERCFQRGSPHLPDEYKKGLSQIKSCGKFLQCIRQCLNIDLPSTCIRSVLATPNFGLSVYNTWLSTLNAEDHQKIHDQIHPTVQLFGEDMAANSAGLVTGILEVLHEKQNFCSIDIPVHEAVAAMLIGIKTMMPMSMMGHFPKLNELQLSMGMSIESTSRVIDTQDITQGKPVNRNSLLVAAGKDKATAVAEKVPIILLTSDQQEALKGPKKQVLIGPAGTGKTVILMAKALELLAKGESVIVVATKRNGEKYKLAFDAHEYKNYQIFDWVQFKTILSGRSEWNIRNILRNITDQMLRSAKQMISGKWYPSLESMMQNNSLIIDDGLFATFRKGETSTLLLKLLLEFKLNVDRTVWVTLDPYQSDCIGIKVYGPRSFNLTEFGKYGYKVKQLRQIMRCSDGVYRLAYNDKLFKWKEFGIEPVLAHKIQGIPSKIIERHVLTSEAVSPALENDLLDVMNQFRDEFIRRPEFLGIIARYSQDMNQHFPDFKYTRLDIAETLSLEWPIVIYVCVRHKSYAEILSRSLERYIARSRAKVKPLNLDPGALQCFHGD